jgi:sec-independent protein translocase protein TatA
MSPSTPVAAPALHRGPDHAEPDEARHRDHRRTQTLDAIRRTLGGMGNLRGWEPVLLLLVVILLFGARRLPDAARGLGRSLRIFKAETKGLAESDDQPKAVENPPAQPTMADTETETGKQTPTQP